MTQRLNNNISREGKGVREGTGSVTILKKKKKRSEANLCSHLVSVANTEVSVSYIFCMFEIFHHQN